MDTGVRTEIACFHQLTERYGEIIKYSPTCCVRLQKFLRQPSRSLNMAIHVPFDGANNIVDTSSLLFY